MEIVTSILLWQKIWTEKSQLNAPLPGLDAVTTCVALNTDIVVLMPNIAMLNLLVIGESHPVLVMAVFATRVLPISTWTVPFQEVDNVELQHQVLDVLMDNAVPNTDIAELELSTVPTILEIGL